MKWFFAVSEVSIDHHDHDFRALIRSAVNSARTNTQLQPHMIFDGEEGAFTQEMRGLGVTVIPHRISFYDRVEAAQKSQRPDWTQYMFVASGALLRLEIPLIEQTDDFVLYTDCDVMFLKDPGLDHVRPDLFAVVVERQSGSHEDMNSGVMVMNLPRLRADLPALVTFLCDRFGEVNGFDQEAYSHFYRGAWSRLTSDYNWKPYRGINPEAFVVHFHGPKPPAIRKLIADPDYEAPDVWRHLYFQNPESYKHYFSLWNNFQEPAPEAEGKVSETNRPTESHALIAHSDDLQEARRLSRTACVSRSLKWYMAVTQDSLNEFQDLIRVAVHSAKKNTNLRPNLMFDGEDCAFTREMRTSGVNVIFNRISFYRQLQETKDRFFPHWSHYMPTAAGAFQRLDIPLVEKEEKFVLYTDCDVMFTGAVDLDRYKPSLFMAAPQFDKNGHSTRELNSGVMLMNVARLGRDLPAIIDHGCDLLSGSSLGYDQEFLNAFYRGAWDPLALRYNWKPYWGASPEGAIIHWHGPKVEIARGLSKSEDFPTNDLYRAMFAGNRGAYLAHIAVWDAFAREERQAREQE